MDVSGRIPLTWMPAIHAGMTKLTIFILWASGKIMNHFVVKSLFRFGLVRYLPLTPRIPACKNAPRCRASFSAWCSQKDLACPARL